MCQTNDGWFELYVSTFLEVSDGEVQGREEGEDGQGRGSAGGSHAIQEGSGKETEEEVVDPYGIRYWMEDY